MSERTQPQPKTITDKAVETAMFVGTKVLPKTLAASVIALLAPKGLHIESQPQPETEASANPVVRAVSNLTNARLELDFADVEAATNPCPTGINVVSGPNVPFRFIVKNRASGSNQQWGPYTVTSGTGKFLLDPAPASNSTKNGRDSFAASIATVDSTGKQISSDIPTEAMCGNYADIPFATSTTQQVPATGPTRAPESQPAQQPQNVVPKEQLDKANNERDEARAQRDARPHISIMDFEGMKYNLDPRNSDGTVGTLIRERDGRPNISIQDHQDLIRRANEWRFNPRLNVDLSDPNITIPLLVLFAAGGFAGGLFLERRRSQGMETERNNWRTVADAQETDAQYNRYLVGLARDRINNDNHEYDLVLDQLDQAQDTITDRNAEILEAIDDSLVEAFGRITSRPLANRTDPNVNADLQDTYNIVAPAHTH